MDLREKSTQPLSLPFFLPTNRNTKDLVGSGAAILGLELCVEDEDDSKEKQATRWTSPDLAGHPSSPPIQTVTWQTENCLAPTIVL